MAGFGTASSTVGPAPQRLAARIAWTWFMVGLVAWSVSPVLRAYSPLTGWLSYWLVGAPLLMLVTVHRHGLAARLRSILVGSQPGRGGGVAAAGSRWDRRQGWRRRAPRSAQARRLAPARRSLVRMAYAALFT